MEWSLNIVMGMGIKPLVRCPEIMRYPLSFRPGRNLPLRSGYESSGDPRGRLTKRFPRAGGEPGLNRSGLKLRPWLNTAADSDSCSVREVVPRKESFLPGGTSLT